MKSVLKKLLIILIVFVIVFEFGFSNTVNAVSGETTEGIVNAITNLAGGVVSIVFWKDRILITALTFILNKIMEGIASTDGSEPEFGDGSVFMTPYDIFFNKYKILSVNFFKLNVPDNEKGSISYKFKTTVSYWFYLVRTISAIILLVVLIYVGIRMALSNAAEDKAKYKKMLVDWVCSLALIFVLQYLAVGIIYLNDSIVSVLGALLKDGEGVADSIDGIMFDFVADSLVGIGITSMISTAVFCCIVAQTLFFFIAYLNRMIKIGFLIIISPLIAITYSIDKMGDGKAQALNNWLKEFVYTILIQPFHCITYIALIHTAFQLTKGAQSITTSFGLPALMSTVKVNKLANGVLTILCLKFVNDGEKVVRKIFGFADDNSKTSMAAGAIVAAAAVHNAKNIGSTARKGVNIAKNKVSNIRQAVSNDKSRVLDSNKFKNSKLGQLTGAAQSKFNGLKSSSLGSKAGGLANSAGQKAKSLSNKISNSKPISGAKTLAGKFKSRGFGKQLRRRLPRALGAMAMMMTYATGDTNLLSANAYGQGVREGTRELFASSEGNLSSVEAENNNKQDEIELNNLNEDIEESEQEISKALEGLGLSGDTSMEKANEIANSDKAKRAVNRAKLAQKDAQKREEEYQAAKREREAQEEKVSAAKEKMGNATTDAEKETARKEVEKEEEELNKKQEAERKAEKQKEDAEAHSLELATEAQKYKNLTAAIEKNAKLEAQREAFGSKEARQLRMSRRTNGASKAKLEAQRSEIRKLILELQANSASKKSNPREGDVDEEFTFDEKDTDSAERTTDNIVKAVDLAVLSGGASIKASDFIIGETGLTSENASTYKNLQRAISDYELLRRQAETAATYSKHANYGGDADSLYDKIYKKSYGSRKG